MDILQMQFRIAFRPLLIKFPSSVFIYKVYIHTSPVPSRSKHSNMILDYHIYDKIYPIGIINSLTLERFDSILWHQAIALDSRNEAIFRCSTKMTSLGSQVISCRKDTVPALF